MALDSWITRSPSLRVGDLRSGAGIFSRNSGGAKPLGARSAANVKGGEEPGYANRAGGVEEVESYVWLRRHGRDWDMWKAFQIRLLVSKAVN